MKIGKRQRLFINAYGLTNALGHDRESVAANWQRGTSEGMISTDAFLRGQHTVVGKVLSPLPRVPRQFKNYNCRNNQLLLHTVEQIRESIEAIRSNFGGDRTGIVLATCTSGIDNAEAAVQQYCDTGKRPGEFHFLQQDLGAGAEFLRQYLDLTGPVSTVSTACTSSGNAFSSAQHLIAAGFCDAVIVGGADTLCQLTVQGFSALKAVSSQQCQPFSKNRDGINIGEASALFVVSREPAEIELYSVGCSSDAHHISAPEPNGTGAKTAIQAALDQAGLDAQQIDYINLHGTATRLNDATESTFTNQLFTEKTLCSSTKSLTGHTLAAASVTELALCAIVLDGLTDNRRVPAQIWDGEYDPSFAPIRIASERDSQPSIRLCMSNSFAFGGSNTSIILGHRQESL
jgi:3-oxoacyl-[acyl-carrier-protein] synthase-1